MRNLSYLIILMSLIGTYPSEMISCLQQKLGENKISTSEDCIQKQNSKKFLKSFGYNFSKSYLKNKKPIIFSDLDIIHPLNQRNNLYNNFLSISFDKLSFLQKKISKIRNKDHLEHPLLG